MNKKGFTLIELLVVIAIIGLLSTLAVVALNNARSKSRDAKRLSDVKQIQTALELYFNDAAAYPASITPGQPIANGSATYMGQVPSGPNTASNEQYVYDGSNPTTYSLTFTLEGATGGFDANPHTATPAGIK